MGTQNLTQSQDSGSYARSIQLRISLASKPHMPGKHGILVRITGAILLRKALFCFVFTFFNNSVLSAF